MDQWSQLCGIVALAVSSPDRSILGRSAEAIRVVELAPAVLVAGDQGEELIAWINRPPSRIEDDTSKILQAIFTGMGIAP